MSKETAAILRKARQNIIDFGRATATLVSYNDGSVCALGAIYLADGTVSRVHDGRRYSATTPDGGELNNYPATAAVVALSTTIRRHRATSEISDGAAYVVYRWNDSYAHSTDNVLDMFELAARAEEGNAA